MKSAVEKSEKSMPEVISVKRFCCKNHPGKIAAVEVDGQEICWDCYYELLKTRPQPPSFRRN